MNPIDRYFELTKEFEQGLDRRLTSEEKDFIRWIVEQEIETAPLGKNTKHFVCHS